LLLAQQSARSRADHAAHAQLLAGFSRILSAQELHMVAEQVPRLVVQSPGTTSGAAAAAAVSSPLLSSHRGRGRQGKRRGAATGRGVPSRSPARSNDPFGAALSLSSPAQLVANARQQSNLQGRERSTPRGVPSHPLRSVLSVRPTASVTAAAATAAAIASRHVAAAAARAHVQEPALDPAIVSYLSSLLSNPAPAAGSAGAAVPALSGSQSTRLPSRPSTQPTSASPFASPRKQKAMARPL
jgi:hypothetical protein